MSMGGTIHFGIGEMPKIDEKVIIEVDSVNRPTGLWEGILIEIGERQQSSWDKDFWANCTAKISSTNEIPHVNYNVYPANAGTKHLMKKNAKLEETIKKLQKESQIEKQMSMAIFKSAVNPDFADEFKEIMKELLGR